MKTVVNQNESVNLLQLVSFKIGNEEFGVDILRVQEINRMMQITCVPNSPNFVEGVINLRGKVIPVIDLRIKLNMAKIQQTSDTRIIVIETKDQTVGFIVDSVKEVLRIPESIMEDPPKIIAGIDSEFIKSVGKLEDRLIILLDLEKIFTEELELEELTT